MKFRKILNQATTEAKIFNFLKEKSSKNPTSRNLFPSTRNSIVVLFSHLTRISFSLAKHQLPVKFKLILLINESELVKG